MKTKPSMKEPSIREENLYDASKEKPQKEGWKSPTWIQKEFKIYERLYSCKLQDFIRTQIQTTKKEERERIRNIIKNGKMWSRKKLLDLLNPKINL